MIEEAKKLVQEAYEQVGFIENVSYGWDSDFKLDEVFYISEGKQIDNSDITQGWHNTIHGMYNGLFAIVFVYHKQQKENYTAKFFSEKLTEDEINLHMHASNLDTFIADYPHHEEFINYQMSEVIKLLKRVNEMGNATAQPIKNIEQIRAMKRELEQGQNGYRNLLIFEVGLASALRISDILLLQKKHIYDGFISIKTKKTDVHKKIELNPRVWKMLSSYIENKTDEDLVFEVKYGQILKKIKQSAANVGLFDITTHSLRKTAAWHYYNATGCDINKTMVLLGHKEPRETVKYLNLSEDEVNRDLVSMDLN